MGDYTVRHRPFVAEPETGAAEVGVEPGQVAVVLASVGGAEAKPATEAGVERQVVDGTAVAVALIGDKQPPLADRPHIAGPGAVDYRHQDVVGHEGIARPGAHPPRLPERWQAWLELGDPLVLQLDGWDEHDYLAAARELVQGGRNPDHGLAGTRHGLDDSLATVLLPSPERVRLPGVQAERSRRGARSGWGAGVRDAGARWAGGPGLERGATRHRGGEPASQRKQPWLANRANDTSRTGAPSRSASSAAVRPWAGEAADASAAAMSSASTAQPCSSLPSRSLSVLRSTSSPATVISGW